jgi:hypothetical protein
MASHDVRNYSHMPGPQYATHWSPNRESPPSVSRLSRQSKLLKIQGTTWSAWRIPTDVF